MKLNIKIKKLRKLLEKTYKCPKCRAVPAIEVVIRDEIQLAQENIETHYIVYCATETCPMKGWSVEVRLSNSIDEALEKWEGLVKDQTSREK